MARGGKKAASRFDLKSPAAALFEANGFTEPLAACDHYAGTVERIQKSLGLQQQHRGNFDITCDLEDGAPVGNEKAFRDQVLQIIAGREQEHGAVGLRTHPPESRLFRDDIEISIKSAGKNLSHLTIPKIPNLQQAKKAVQFIRATERRAKLKRRIPIHLLIETRAAVEEVQEIAAIPGVRGLDFGLMDFVSDHCGIIPGACMSSPGQFEHQLVIRAKIRIAAACALANKVAAHNVTTNYNNIEQTTEDARRARRLFGFTRMWSIHPSQIQPIVNAMAPDHTEIETACNLLLAAQASDWAPISFSGRLHDRASYRYFWTVLKRARKAGRTLPDDVERSLLFD